MLDVQTLMNEFQDNARRLMDELGTTKEFSERMEITLYDLIPNLDEIGIRKLLGRLEVIKKGS